MNLRYPRHMLCRELALLVAVFPVLLNAKAQDAKKHGPTHPFPSQLIQELTTLRDAALEDNYAYDRVTYLTENIGARPSGSAQAAKAVDYVASGTTQARTRRQTRRGPSAALGAWRRDRRTGGLSRPV